jgi:membrane-associated phospholipid phosphatase
VADAVRASALAFALVLATLLGAPALAAGAPAPQPNLSKRAPAASRRAPAASRRAPIAPERSHASAVPATSIGPDPTSRALPWRQRLPFYLGETWRYQHCNIFVRFGLDVVGTPIHFLYWDEMDWLWAGMTAATTLALMAPTDPSPDARLQYWVVDQQSEPLGYVFPRLTTERFSAFGLGLWGASAAVGWVFGLPDIQEWSSLFLETMGLSQILHNAQKLMMGREGPEQGTGRGIIYGPSAGPRLWPSGTPSGHTISVFALATLTADYFDKPWLDALAYFSYTYICLSVVYNNQHFISDVVWGAPLGYFLGKWMAEHRSSRYTYDGTLPVRKKRSSLVGVLPWSDPAVGVQGLKVMWRW